jgi:hypothetical protein
VTAGGSGARGGARPLEPEALCNQADATIDFRDRNGPIVEAGERAYEAFVDPRSLSGHG